MPYEHDDKTLARPWAIPGMEGYEHRIGGLEKANNTGNVDYSPENHELMVRQRQKKVDVIADFIPEVKIDGKKEGDLLVISWGGVFGSVKSGVRKAQQDNLSVSHIHLRHLNPFPSNLGECILNFDKVLIPELNMGHLKSIIRDRYLVDAKGFNKISGKPFTSSEIFEKIKIILTEE
tara:strand:- start:209 stop:739 length:531 start_codon:yes stop_codon:yes gene_type:complete